MNMLSISKVLVGAVIWVVERNCGPQAAFPQNLENAGSFAITRSGSSVFMQKQPVRATCTAF
jgi:hypothetical protein